MKLINADALERDGWQMSRTVRVSTDAMELQTRKPTDFPPIIEFDGEVNKVVVNGVEYKPTIESQNAIDVIDKYISGFDAIDANFLDGLKTAKKLIKELPSTQPENMCVNLDVQKITTHKSDFSDLNDFDEHESACSDCQEFDCYGCEHKEESK